MTEPILEIRDLCVDFTSGSRAIHHLNLTLHKGEILALVGESGSGKSVSSLSILQLLPSPPALYPQGEICFHQQNQVIDLLKASETTLEQIRGHKIAMIFQEPMTALNPVLTCGFQVGEAIQKHLGLDKQAARAKTIALFEQVKLPNPTAIFERYPHQLSGGQKQRVMIAMAMSCEPALLICDEPTTALDVTVQQKILVLLKELQQANGMGILFITHDLGLVASFADRVAVMYKGRVVESNDTHTLFSHPQHPYTKALLACRPALHPKGEKLPVVSDFMEQDTHGNIIEKTRPAVVSTIPQTRVSLEQSPLVAVKDLHIWYPTRKNLLGKPLEWMKAVNGVSFDVYPGETLGLVGESGCGKTTLGRAILGLTPIQSGNILYKGVPVSQQDRKTWLPLRREMQLIFQDPYASLNPRIRIGAAIAEPLLVHGLARNAGEARDQVIELLEKVNLQADHYHRFPHEFSGGQRQRIVIARALALKPSFVVCDESVAALDVSVQAQVLNLLNELKQDFGFTALFISHDLSVVKYLSDRIIVMQKGQIVESGDPQSIYTRPANPYTRELINAIPGTPDSR